MGAASSRDRMARGRVICSTKAHSRVIDSIPVRPCLVAGWPPKSGRPALDRRERSGSDALCFAEDPASGVAPFCAAGSRASPALPCPACPELVAGNLATYLKSTSQVQSRSTAGWLPGGTTICTVSRRRLVHNAGQPKNPITRPGRARRSGCTLYRVTIRSWIVMGSKTRCMPRCSKNLLEP